MKPSSTFRDRNFLILILYKGPWERLGSLIFGMRADGSLRWEIPDKPAGFWAAVNAAANWAETRDAIWRAKYAIKRREPSKFWSR